MFVWRMGGVFGESFSGYLLLGLDWMGLQLGVMGCNLWGLLFYFIHYIEREFEYYTSTYGIIGHLSVCLFALLACPPVWTRLLFFLWT